MGAGLSPAGGEDPSTSKTHQISSKSLPRGKGIATVPFKQIGPRCGREEGEVSWVSSGLRPTK